MKRDPGPCPVDDSPHTTCTSPDYDPLAILAGPITPATTVIVASGQVLAAEAEPPATIGTDRFGRTRPTGGTFTAATYPRKKRGGS